MSQKRKMSGSLRVEESHNKRHQEDEDDHNGDDGVIV
jgi:hypothetical protein